MLISLIAIAALVGADGTSGKVSGAHGEPLPGCFVALYDTSWALRGSGTSAEDGAFTIAAPAAEGFLQLQPVRKPGAGGVGVYSWQPRVYALGAKDSALALNVPPAVNYVIAAYGEDGKLMRWKDWEAQGKYGPQFLYVTDSSLRARPATIYPVYGEITNGDDGGRPNGLPAVLVEPGDEVEIHALFWKTRGYGKLQLSTPVPALKSAGQSLLINWNLALAQSVIARARDNHFEDQTEKDWFGKYATELDALEAKLPKAADQLSTPEDAAAADEVLAKALDVADRAAVDRAKRRALLARFGAAHLPEGVKPDALKLKRPAFLFGAYQGSPFLAQDGKPYAAQPAYEAARDGGFRLATMLPAWGWTGPFVNDPAGLEKIFGPEALGKMGYTVKAHGICWMQDFMDILPPEVRGLPHDQLLRAALNYQQALLDALGKELDIVEAVNEPATTNAVGLTRDEMIGFLKSAAANIAARKKSALVNSPHEFNYGAKYAVYLPSGKPVDAYPETFASFLDAAAAAHALDKVDIIGLQVYPGFHLAGGAPGKPFEGPAWTPAFFERVLDTYARFRKAIHITEFSVPSSYGADWKAGYWKRPWDEPTQADYAEAIYTIAFGHPNVGSIGWWDITDEKPSVETGGLMHADRTPKPVFDRLSHLVKEAGEPRDAAGGRGGSLPGGAYTYEAKGADGKAIEKEYLQVPGWKGD